MDEVENKRQNPQWLTPWVVFLLKSTIFLTAYLALCAWFGTKSLIGGVMMVTVVSVVMFSTYLVLKAAGMIRDVPGPSDEETHVSED